MEENSLLIFGADNQQIYELPCKVQNTTIIPDENFRPVEFFMSVHAGNLRGGLQDGDVELFIGEQWVNSEAFDVGIFTANFLRLNSDEYRRASEYRAAQGIQSLSSLIQYFERTYARNIPGDADKWMHIFQRVERLKTFMTEFNISESSEQSVARIINIKRKLLRLPRLDAHIDAGDEVQVDDAIAGLLHPRDSALIGLLGMMVGVVVTRTGGISC